MGTVVRLTKVSTICAVVIFRVKDSVMRERNHSKIIDFERFYILTYTLSLLKVTDEILEGGFNFCVYGYNPMVLPFP